MADPPTFFPGLDPETSEILRRAFAELSEEITRLRSEPTGPRETKSVVLVPGQTRRAAPPETGMTGHLPAPSPANGSQVATLLIEGARGSITITADPHVSPTGRLEATKINGFDSATFSLDGEVSFRSNGVDCWTSVAQLPAEAVAASQLASPLVPVSAEYLLGSASSGLPQSRVAQASTEISPVLSSAGFVSWVLDKSADIAWTGDHSFAGARTTFTNGILGGEGGSEGGGINVGGATWSAPGYFSSIGSTDLLNILSHQHSTTLAGGIGLSRSNSDDSSHGTIASGQAFGHIWGIGYGDTRYEIGCGISLVCDGAAGNSDMPGRLEFCTVPNGSSTVTERLRIASTGAFGLSGATYGSSGQVITSQGSGSPPVWADQTDTTYTAGDRIDITSEVITWEGFDLAIENSLASTEWKGIDLGATATATWGIAASPITGLLFLSVNVVADWNDILSNGATSGANNPIVDSGQHLQVGGSIFPPSYGDIRLAGNAVRAIVANNGLDIEAEGGGLDLICTGDVDLQPGSGNSARVFGGLEVQEDSSPPSVTTGFGLWAALPHDSASKPAYISDDDVQQDIRTLARGDWVPCFQEDDFVSVLQSGGILFSDTPWAIITGGAGGTVSAFESNFDGGTHPGIANLTTFASDNANIGIVKGDGSSGHGPFMCGVVDRMVCVARPSTNSSILWMMALLETYSLTSMTEGARVFVDTDTFGDGNIRFQTNDGATTQETNLGFGISNIFGVFEMERESDGSWNLYHDGSLVASHSTNVPASGTFLQPSIAVVARANASRILRVDYWAIRANTGSRQ